MAPGTPIPKKNMEINYQMTTQNDEISASRECLPPTIDNRGSPTLLYNLQKVHLQKLKTSKSCGNLFLNIFC